MLKTFSAATSRSGLSPAAVSGGVGPGEGQVAHEDRGALAERVRVAAPARVAVQLGELDVDRRAAAADPGAVHDVVVDEGEDVEQLDCAGRPPRTGSARSRRRRAANPSRGIRADALAAAQHERAEGGGDGLRFDAEEAEGVELAFEDSRERRVHPFEQGIPVQRGRPGRSRERVRHQGERPFHGGATAGRSSSLRPAHRSRMHESSLGSSNAPNRSGWQRSRRYCSGCRSRRAQSLA